MKKLMAVGIFVVAALAIGGGMGGGLTGGPSGFSGGSVTSFFSTGDGGVANNLGVNNNLEVRNNIDAGSVRTPRIDVTNINVAGIDAGAIVATTVRASGAASFLSVEALAGVTFLSGQNCLSDGSSYFIATNAGGWVYNMPSEFTSAQNAGSKTLSGGSATQTIKSATQDCVCMDLTAPGNLLTCDNAGTTTLTITASGASDVVKYICF